MPAHDQQTSLPGRIMALDLGEKRHGVALSDPGRRLARSFAVIPRRSRRQDFARLGAIAREQGVTLLLVGLPASAGERESPRIAWMRHYATALAQALGLPLAFWDESYSTIDAASSLQERGLGNKARQARLDAVAAAIFLQEYLDSQGRQAPPAQP